MEQNLFSWTGWDGDIECMTFYNVVLKTPIGKFHIGEKFDSAEVLWNEGILQLNRKTENDPTLEYVVVAFKIGIYITEEIK